MSDTIKVAVTVDGLVTAWEAEADRYEALARDLGDEGQRERYLGRAKQCRRCAFDVKRYIEQQDRSPAGVLADEIEAEPNAGMTTFHDAVRWANENYGTARLLSSPKQVESRRARAAAWLIIAQRILARESGR